MRRETADLRSLEVPRELEPYMEFHLKHVRPTLLAVKNLSVSEERAVWLTRSARPMNRECLNLWYQADFFFVTGSAVSPQDVRRSMASLLYSSAMAEGGSPENNSKYAHELVAMQWRFDHHNVTAREYYAPVAEVDLPTADGKQPSFLRDISGPSMPQMEQQRRHKRQQPSSSDTWKPSSAVSRDEESKVGVGRPHRAQRRQ